MKLIIGTIIMGIIWLAGSAALYFLEVRKYNNTIARRRKYPSPNKMPSKPTFLNIKK